MTALGLKGWVKVKPLGREVERYSTTPSKIFGAVKIHIRKYADAYSVDTSGKYLYVKKSSFRTLSEAREFARRIMKYVNYGRFTLKVLDERYFR